MNKFMIKKLMNDDLGDFWEIVVLAGSEGYYPQHKKARIEWFQKIMNECDGFDYYGAFDEGKLMGGMAILDYKMNLRSSIINLSGVGMVHTDMLHKKEKICKEMMTYFLQSNRKKGVNILFLSPFRPDFYKEMGFGYGTSMYHYRISPTSFPNSGNKDHLSYADDNDKQDILDCHNRILQTTNGVVSKKPFFFNSEFGNGKKFIVYKNQGIIQGALIFSFGGEKELFIDDWFYENKEALNDYCTFLNSQSDQFQRVFFSTPDEYFYYILHDPTDGIRNLENCTSTIDNMFRVINVPGLFDEMNGTNFNDSNCTVTINVHDDFCPENNGPTTVKFTDGKAAILPNVNSDVQMDLDIADFSSLMVGAITVKSLYRLGLLDVSDISKIDLLESIFINVPKPLTTEHA